MKARTEAVFRFAAPVRVAAYRLGFFALFTVAFSLMLLSKAEVLVVERARTFAADLLAPVFSAVSEPARMINSGTAEIHNLLYLHQENIRMREELARLQQWQSVARRLDDENQSLRGLLNYVPEPSWRSISTRAIADAGGAFVRNMLVEAGSEQGVSKGAAAVTGEGLVGRVTEVGTHSARVLLITDLNSRIPVMIENSRDRAVLAGDNTIMPRLLYLSQDSHVSVGDRVVTSAQGGALPPGLPVGIVASVGERGIQVQTFADWTRIEYVRLIDYHLTGLPTAVNAVSDRIPRGLR
jgi:rod shape-determining protein MreC